MTDEHIKGTISQAQGKVEEVLGRVTGDKEKEAHGRAKQVPGRHAEGPRRRPGCRPRPQGQASGQEEEGAVGEVLTDATGKRSPSTA